MYCWQLCVINYQKVTENIFNYFSKIARLEELNQAINKI